MAKKKKTPKAKEAIRVRFKKLANGNQSIYLDCYKDGKRTYEFLKLYLIPEVDDAAKMMNKNTLQAANAIKSQRLIEITNESAGLSKSLQRSKMLLIDWMNQYKERKAQTSRSDCFAVIINKTIRHLIAYRGDKVTMRQVDKDYCRGYIAYLKSVKKADGELLNGHTAHGYYNVFNCALNLAVRENIIPFNPFSKIDADEKIQKPESTREFLTIDEVKTLIKADCKKESIKRAFLFGCFCGLRFSDIERLRWGDIQSDGDNTILRIIVKKTNRPLTLPLSQTALFWLPKRGDAKQTDKVFDIPSLGNYQNVLLKEWVKSAGITKKVTFHVARHTFATMELTAGADLYTTSKLLGHSNVTTTQIYAKIVDKKKAEAVNLVSNLFTE